jgi:hypothetical protein
MGLIDYIDIYAAQLENMIYWTSKRSGVSVRFRAYRLREIQDTYSLLDKKPLAEVYVFLHKEHHGSCIGIIKGENIKHFESREDAFEKISNQLQQDEQKRKDKEISDMDQG